MNKSKPCMLIADDEQEVRKMLSVTLESMDYKVIEASSGNEALRLAASNKPDAIILDVLLPDINGDEVIEKLRQWSDIPVMVLSEADDASDIVNAFEIGANDFVSKPFNMDILIARLKSMLKNNYKKENGDSVLTAGDLNIDLVKHEVKFKDKVLELSPKEYDLLCYLIKNKGKMLTHKQILKEVWGDAHSHDKQYLRVYIMQVRHKIEDDNEEPIYIKTEAGIGYRFEDAPKSKKAA